MKYILLYIHVYQQKKVYVFIWMVEIEVKTNVWRLTEINIGTKKIWMFGYILLILN